MNRGRNALSPERLEEIRRQATAPRVMMKLRCGHEAWVPDFTDPKTTDCWVRCKIAGTPVGLPQQAPKPDRT